MKRIALLLTMLCLGLAPALAAQRVVVAEDITGTWCQYCPAAANGLDQLYNEAGDSLITLALHGGDAYETAETGARIAWYAIGGYPTVIFGGTAWVVGSDGSGSAYNNYHYYRPVFDSLKQLPSPVEMAMRFDSIDFNGRTGKAAITIRNVSADTVRGTLQFIITERGIPAEWFGLHEIDFVVRDMVPDQNGQAVAVAPGDSIVVSRSFAIDPSWVMGACRYAALLQQDDKTIIQGAQIWIYSPALALQRYTVADAGDGDGYFEPGETGQVAVWVKNNRWAAGSGALVRMTTADPYVSVDNGLLSIGDMQPGDSTNNAGAPFTFTVLPTATMPEGHWVKLALEECIYSAAAHDTIRTLDSVMVTVGSPTVIFSDNFEAGRGQWLVGKIGTSDTTTVNWDTTSADCHSPGCCVTDSRWGNYKRGIFRYIAMAESVDLTPFASVTVSWWERFATQPSLDLCRPMYSANNGKNWNILDQYSGDQPSWRQRTYAVVSCDTIHGYKLRFMITSNSDTITADGWYVDDVTIMGYTKAGVEGEPAGQPSGRGIAVGCYPNPSPGAAIFHYSLPRAGRVSLSLYDICGRLVTTLADGPQPAGAHSVRWNGAGRDGRRLSSGVYFYRLDAGGRSATGKLILIK